MGRRRFAALVLIMVISLSACSAKGAETDRNGAVQNEKISYSKEQSPASYATEIGSYESPDVRLSNMNLVASEDDLQLYFDEATADIAIVNGSEIHFATPWNLSSDLKSTPEQKKRIASTVVINYMDSKQSIGTLGSFADCISKGQYTFQKFKNGIRVNMTLGVAEQRSLAAPAIPKDRFEELSEKLEGRAKTRLNAFYKLYDTASSPKNQIDTIKERFPIVEETPIYVLKEVSEKEKGELEGYLEKAGYDFKQMEQDLKKLDVEEANVAKPFCKLSVCYQLNGGKLSVFIPADSIEYNESAYKLLNVELLGYLLSADCTSNGYLLIPDGSGAVMGFNNSGTKLGNEITMPVYGYDRTLTYSAGNATVKTASVPVFGIKKENSAVMCVIDKGAALADIIATTGGNFSGYARGGVRFNYRSYDSFEYKDVNTKYSWQLSDSKAYGGECSFDVYFFNGEASGYSDMARAYRDTLSLKEEKSGKSELELVLGALGSIKHQEQIMFIPIMKNIALTSFEDAYKISEELSSEGIKNLSVRYLGWSQGGLKPQSFNRVKPLGVLGGKSGLKKLAKGLKELDVKLFVDTNFVYIAENKLFDGFTAYSDTSRMLDKTYAGYNQIAYSSSLYKSESFKYALTPQKMLETADSFLKDFKKLDDIGLSMSDIGRDLNSNKDVKRAVNREAALGYYNDILKKAEGKEIITDGSNGYVFPYASMIIGMSNESTGYPDADYSIPFLQMVLHGSVGYTTKAINLSGDNETEILKAVETGSGLYYEIAYQNTDKVKTSEFADYYSSDYSTWKNTILEQYKKVNAVIGDLADLQITSHEYPEEGLSSVTYENGVKIYVNYNLYDCTVGELSVPARGFIRVEK